MGTKRIFFRKVLTASEGDGQSKQLFYSEEAAMKMIGSWESGTYKADSEEFYNKLGWFPIPGS